MIQIIGNRLSQWDVGRLVEVTGEASHVHFANQGDSKAVIIDVEEGKAKIPDYLLQTGKTLLAYEVLNGVTLESYTFAVRKRERPENYVYEEDQRNFIYVLIQDAGNAIARAIQTADEADRAAYEADLAAHNARGASVEANAAANNATMAADSANKAAINAAHTAKSLMVVGEAEGEVIALDDAIDQFFVGCRIFGKTTQDGTPTPDAPVELVSAGKNGSINVTVAGKNLAKVLYAQSLTTRYGSLVNIKGFKLLKGVKYSVSFDTENTGVYCYINSKAFSYYRFQQDGTRKSFVFTYTEDKMMDIEPDGSTILVSRDSETSDVASGLISNVQIEVAGFATEYEPYKAQTLTVLTPNGLPGIPVTSGGNYTDANGQQWICDEIDLARGVYVQRIGFTDLTDALWVKNDSGKYYANKDRGLYSPIYRVLCTHINGGSAYDGVRNDVIIFINDNFDIRLNIVLDDDTVEAVKETMNGATLIGVLISPIETVLSTEELTAYAALHTYKDHTTVSNDAGAWMDLEYVMDTKKYIDSLVLSGGGSIIPATIE